MIPAFAELYRPHRYKVFYGGRGSGKSYSFAEAIVIICSMVRCRVLCCREVQNSIVDSSYRLLKDIITSRGFDGFQLTGKEIRHNNGSLIIFKGLFHNEENIKSTEGIDICWVEEAAKVSEKSWETLIPTVRKENSEIWISFNPQHKDDPTYKRFILNTPPDAYVRKINFDENPFFPEVLRDEMEWDKKNDYEKYLHIWEGNPRTISDAQVFNGKFVVESFPDDLYKKADRLFFGADFGFANDPNTLIRCFIHDKKLYIDHEAYGVGVEINDMAKMYETVPDVRRWNIFADCARPETISYLKRHDGFRISAAPKWAGSIEDGITYIRGFEKVVIHPRCKHTAEEFALYSYKIDRFTDEVLADVVDANNHCIAEGELVTTARGDIPIEDVTTDDYVLTRDGYKRVLASVLTGINRRLVSVRTSNFVLKCTPDHRIFTVNRGFVEAQYLTSEDVLLCQKEKLPNTAVMSGTDTQTLSGEVIGFTIPEQRQREDRYGFIDKSGKTQMAQFLMDFISTIRTEIPLIMRLKTSLACLRQNTQKNIRGRKNNENGILSTLTKSDLLLRSGIEARKGKNGIQNTRKQLGSVILTCPKESATIAVNPLNQRRTMINSVVTPVSPLTDVRQGETTNTVFVKNAVLRSLSINTVKKGFVAERVQGVTVLESQSKNNRVYDLTVDTKHEFFVNGVLVSNCVDALRYALSNYIKGKHRGFKFAQET